MHVLYTNVISFKEIHGRVLDLFVREELNNVFHCESLRSISDFRIMFHYISMIPSQQDILVDRTDPGR